MKAIWKDLIRKGIKGFAVIGCDIVDYNDPQPQVEMTEEEIFLLSKLEHRRWSAERSLAGWDYAKKKNEVTRETPYLTSWENLSERIKDYDRRVVTMIPEVLKEAGKKIIKQ